MNNTTGLFRQYIKLDEDFIAQLAMVIIGRLMVIHYIYFDGYILILHIII